MGRCTTLYNWGHSTTRNEKGVTHTENLLKNKTAVVYGAGSIGSAVATAFAKAGATVFAADHSEEASKRFAGKDIQKEQVDVLDKDAVAAFEPGHISQTLNARIFSYSTCCTLQQLVARQCRGGFGLESTADVLLTKFPMF